MMILLRYTYTFLLLGCLIFACRQSGAGELTLPPMSSRLKIFDGLISEMERLDAQALQARSNRPEKWSVTVQNLRTELQKVHSLFEMGRVFKRLTAAYTNIHGRSFLVPELDETLSDGAVHLPFQILPEVSEGKDGRIPNFRLAKVESPIKRDLVGARIVAINGKPIDQWSEENFLFCKYALRWQCEFEISENLQNELLDWNRHQPLTLTLNQNERVFQVPISPQITKYSEENKVDFLNPPCGVTSIRYPGWDLKYHGFHICAFESQRHPGVVLLRIRSFIYYGWKGDPALPLQLRADAELFYQNYWKSKLSKTKTLVIDLIGNPGGGETPALAQMLLMSPFQEEYVRFKKVPELEKPDIYSWEPGQKRWFDDLKSSGSYSQIKEGELLPEIPMFCVAGAPDCAKSRYAPRTPPFRGKIKVLINHRCNSSCVGFSQTLESQMNENVSFFGQPNSGDSSYGRVTIGVNWVTKGAFPTLYRLTPSPDWDAALGPVPQIRQNVCITHLTDKNGKSLIGASQPSRISLVPRTWNQTEDEWAKVALSKALR